MSQFFVQDGKTIQIPGPADTVSINLDSLTKTQSWLEIPNVLDAR